MGATSGNSLQVSLPAVVSMTAAGWAAVVVAGLAAAVAAGGFFAGAVFAAGVACDHPAEHVAAISKQIERLIRIDAPEHRASTGQAGEDTRPYVNCDDCEVRFYPRALEKVLTGRCPRGFGLHFPAYTFHFAEDANRFPPRILWTSFSL
jgi:hypothetical protein